MIYVGWANGSLVNPTFLSSIIVGLPKRLQPNLPVHREIIAKSNHPYAPFHRKNDQQARHLN